jgi:S1-C subfamily serine protease
MADPAVAFYRSFDSPAKNFCACPSGASIPDYRSRRRGAVGTVEVAIVVSTLSGLPTASTFRVPSGSPGKTRAAARGNDMSRNLWFGFLVTAVWVVLVGNALADDLYETLKNRTCIVVDREKGSRGTGFVIDRERHLVATNYHVAQVGSMYQIFWELVTSDGEPWTHQDYLVSYDSLHSRGKASIGVVVAQDSSKDLAILWVDNIPDWIEETTFAAELPDDQDVVHFVGHPGDRLPFRYSIGQISYVGSDSWTYEDVAQFVSADILQFRTQSYGGFSGSAVVNDDGELVGVLSGGSTTHATAIQAEEVRTLLDSVCYAKAFAIHNERSIPVHFQIRLSPADDWASFEVAAGHYHWWWTSDSDASPEVRFDYSYADGFQEKSYNLGTQIAIVGKGGTPPCFWRREYKFVNVSGGVEIYLK